jgi:4a-hydroxytetrahydrobiopterin dehydratase
MTPQPTTALERTSERTQMPTRIPTPEIDATLDAAADEWQRRGRMLTTTFTFASFRQAFDFMIEVAEQADARQHHPNWTILDNKVTIELSTHDAGGVTDLDVDFALLISRIARSRSESARPKRPERQPTSRGLRPRGWDDR